MAWVLFDSFIKGQHDGTITGLPSDLDADDIRIALIKVTVAPIKATHDYWNDLQANEVTGTNYTGGGKVLTGKTVVLETNVGIFDAADVVWAQDATGFNDARYAVMYKYNATASAAPLIGFYDFGGAKGNVASALTLEFASTGIVRWGTSGVGGGAVAPPTGPPWNFSYLKNNTTRYGSPASVMGAAYSRAKPAYQELFYDDLFDPDHRCPITRITGVNGATITGTGKWGLVNRTGYPTRCPWNADQSMIFIEVISGGLGSGNRCLISGTSPYAPISMTTGIPTGGETRWHPTDPALMLYANTAASGSSSGEFGTWNPVTGVKAPIRNFTGDGYSSIAFNGKGALSWDGQLIAITGLHAGVEKAFVYNYVTNTKYANITHPSGNIGRLSVSASGLRMYLGDDNDERDWFYNRDGTLITTTPMDPLKLSHYDTFLDGANDIIDVGAAGNFAGTTGGQIYKVNLADATAAMVKIQAAGATGYQNHTSCRDVTGAWSLTGFIQDELETRGYNYDDELVLMKADGSDSRRVSHMHSKGPYQYDNEMQPVLSQDGGQIIWHCRWEAAGNAVTEADSYLIDLRNLI